MSVVELNGIRLSYQVAGCGAMVLLVMGMGSLGRVWRLHQVPALVAAGYQVVTVDNRGIAPSDECAGGMTIEDLVGDAAALTEHLGGGPARLVGTSLGARIVQDVQGRPGGHETAEGGVDHGNEGAGTVGASIAEGVVGHAVLGS